MFPYFSIISKIAARCCWRTINSCFDFRYSGYTNWPISNVKKNSWSEIELPIYNCCNQYFVLSLYHSLTKRSPTWNLSLGTEFNSTEFDRYLKKWMSTGIATRFRIIGKFRSVLVRPSVSLIPVHCQRTYCFTTSNSDIIYILVYTIWWWWKFTKLYVRKTTTRRKVWGA